MTRLRPQLPPLLPMLGLTWVFLHYAPPESLLGLIGQCMILGLLYLVGYFLVTLHREERQQIISALGSMTGSRRPDQGVEL